MRLFQLSLMLFTFAVLTPVQFTAAQPMPVAQSITLKQALKQEAVAYKGRWITQRNMISHDGKAKLANLADQINKEVRENPAQKAALQQKYLEEADKINKATQAQLNKTYADLLDAHNYNVEQIKKSYGK